MSEKKTVHDAHKKNVKIIKAKMKRLRKLLDAHWREDRTSGHVGNLAHVAEYIQEATDFLELDG